MSFKRATSALAIYLALCLVLFGTPILSRLAEAYLGWGTDFTVYIWALAWWPYALMHHLNPFVSRVIWAPTGFNITWLTSIPGPSLFFMPVTRVFGPVVSANILCLLCPPSAAFCAFLLCHYICRSFWPALFGGYIFGFSQYVLCRLTGHLPLLFIFPIPLAVYLALLRLNQEISGRLFVGLFALVGSCEFLSSTEIFATATMFGATALMLGYLLFDAATVERIKIVTAEIACAYGAVMLVLAPYLYYTFALGVPGPINSATRYSNDLFTFFLPTYPVLLGGRTFGGLRGFKFWWEMSGYLGPGLWITIALYAHGQFRSKACQLLMLILGLIALLSLGPVLHIDGVAVVLLPWSVVGQFPLINQALPGRFGLYLFLIAAVIAAAYLSEAKVSRGWKVSLALLSIVFLAPYLPLIHSAATRVNTPVFFRSGEYKQYISQGDALMFLPQSARSHCMLWQAQSDFYFRTTTAHTGFMPTEFSHWPVEWTFDTGNEIVDFPRQLDAFLGAHQVKAVIVDPRAQEGWSDLLEKSGMRPVAVGGVLFYRVPRAVLASFGTSTAHEMAEEEAAISFRLLLDAANRYWRADLPLSKLTPWEAKRRKVFAAPQNSKPVSADLHWWQNLWLGVWSGSMIGVGIDGDYEDLEPLIQQYRPYTSDIFFPFPSRLIDDKKHGSGFLLMTFTRAGLEHALNPVAKP